MRNNELLVEKYDNLTRIKDEISKLKSQRHQLSVSIVRLEDEEEELWKEILKEMRKGEK